MTLFELVLVVSVASVAVVATATYTLPWIARERSRSAVYDVQSYLQLARIEAVSRNRNCRFVVDTSTRIVQVFDGNGTSSTSDDTLLYESSLPSQVQFARPDSGSAVTLSQIGSTSQFETVFTSDGIVLQGTGEVAVFGGNEYNRVLVYGAGGVTVDRWSGSGWVNEGGQVTSSAQSSPSDGGTTGGGTGGDGYVYQNY
jgi:Tfp pilus assembly protein FimT